MIIINTKDMIQVFRSRMKVLSESLGKLNPDEERTRSNSERDSRKMSQTS